jgi:hypothetical protein
MMCGSMLLSLILSPNFSDKKKFKIYFKLTMDKEESQSQITYFRYRTLEDMLKVILFSTQSALGLTPMLYHIKYNDSEILFIETGALGGALVHYILEKEKPDKKFIELKQLTGEFQFVDKIGTDTHSIYIPILELEESTLEFPS